MFSLVVLLSGLPVGNVSSAVAPAPVAITSAQRVSPARLIRNGRQLAVQNCQTCHAIGRTGRSPNPAAPQFRYLSRKYPIDTLSETFAEGVFIGHSVMPEFQFAPQQIDGLMAYLKSVQAPPIIQRKKR